MYRYVHRVAQAVTVLSPTCLRKESDGHLRHCAHTSVVVCADTGAVVVSSGADGKQAVASTTLVGPLPSERGSAARVKDPWTKEEMIQATDW